MNTIKHVGYFYDNVTNTLTMTKAFQKKAGVAGSPEYEVLVKIRQDEKDVRIVVSDSRSKSSSKPAVKFSDMEAYIKMFPEERQKSLFNRFEMVKKLSKTQRSPYQYVLEWFIDYFPNYGSKATFDENGILTNLKTADELKKNALNKEVEALGEEMKEAKAKVQESIQHQSEEDDDEKAS